MLNSAFDHITGDRQDFWPAALRPEIEAVNARVYEAINNGVYRAGFALTQAAYEEAAHAVFEGLDWVEARLGRHRYLTGDRITEADWRLATTLFRFDAVYHGHFKCNRRRIVDYPRLWPYARELYQTPEVAATVRFDHIMRHYYASHESINPTRIVPLGPDIDRTEPHGRGRRDAA
jgi:putative glutathione S-transferase